MDFFTVSYRNLHIGIIVSPRHFEISLGWLGLVVLWGGK
jgi:hypothetical protein